MAKKLKSQKDWDEYDTARMNLAVRAVGRDENLRFFIRALLNAYGVGDTPEGGNAIETARAIGRHSAGMDLVATLLTHDPQLYPALISEDLAENAERTGGTTDEHS